MKQFGEAKPVQFEFQFNFGFFKKVWFNSSPVHNF